MAKEGINIQEYQEISKPGSPSSFQRSPLNYIPNRIGAHTDLIKMFPKGLVSPEAKEAAFAKLQALGI